MSTIINLNSVAANDVVSFNQTVQLSVDVDNGSFVALGAMLSGNPDVRVGSTPTDVTTDEIVLIASPEIVEVNGLRIELTDISNFTNKANRPARGIRLNVGDVITMTDDGIDGTTAVGQYVIPQDGSFKGVASATKGSAVISLLVLEKPKIATGRIRKDATRMQVVKA